MCFAGVHCGDVEFGEQFGDNVALYVGKTSISFRWVHFVLGPVQEGGSDVLNTTWRGDKIRVVIRLPGSQT
jgi:hypothetical protein